MARIRTVKPEFWTSEDVVECPRDVRLFFIGLWNFADCAGRIPLKPRMLKMRIFPGEDDIGVDDVSAMVRRLVRAGLLIEYAFESQRYLQVTGWHHQRIDKPNYRYPPRDRQGRPADISALVLRPVDERSPPEGKGGDRSGAESSRGESDDSPAASAAAREVLEVDEVAARERVVADSETPANGEMADRADRADRADGADAAARTSPGAATGDAPTRCQRLPSAGPTGAAATPGLKEQLFSRGDGGCLGYLIAHGVRERHARGQLGKWRQRHGDVAVIDAVAAAEREAASAPVAFIEACLKRQNVGAAGAAGAPGPGDSESTGGGRRAGAGYVAGETLDRDRMARFWATGFWLDAWPGTAPAGGGPSGEMIAQYPPLEDP